MRQKQSKENSRKHHQKSSPAVKREAESLSISTNTIEKNEKARLESRITSGMSYLLRKQMRWGIICRFITSAENKAPEEMYNPVLRRQVYQFKKTREGVTFMCREMDKIYRDGERNGQKIGQKIGQERGEKIGQERGEKIGQKRGEKIGRERGEKIGKKQGVKSEQRRIVTSLKRKGKTMDEIAYLTGIHETVVRKLLG